MPRTNDPVEVRREVLQAILSAAQDGESPCVPFSRDQGEFAKRAVALSMKKCGQIAKMAESLLLGEPVKTPQPDTADGEPLSPPRTASQGEES